MSRLDNAVLVGPASGFQGGECRREYMACRFDSGALDIVCHRLPFG
jgi:hypothetical protein